MDEGAVDLENEFWLDLFGEFDVPLSDDQMGTIGEARQNLLYTLALLTSTVPETCTEGELLNMHKGLKACLMFRNIIRKTAMDAMGEPIPTPEELEAYREQITASKETIH